MREVTGQPIMFASNGEKLEDFDVFHPDRMASRILGMGDMLTLIEQAQQHFDEAEAEAMAAKLAAGNQFTLDDFLEQLQAIRKMGPIGNLLGMLPGMGQMKDALAQVDDKDLDRTAAIIRGMTPAERENPKIINGSRRLRIANGSGVKVNDVNQLVDRFFEARKMMGQMGGMGLPGMRKRSATKSSKNTRKGKKGKNQRGRGPTTPRLPAGLPPGAFGPTGLGGVGGAGGKGGLPSGPPAGDGDARPVEAQTARQVMPRHDDPARGLAGTVQRQPGARRHGPARRAGGQCCWRGAGARSPRPSRTSCTRRCRAAAASSAARRSSRSRRNMQPKPGVAETLLRVERPGSWL